MKSFKEILGKTSSFSHLDNVRKISAKLHSFYKTECLRAYLKAHTCVN
jgi:hypothetical protein